VFGLIWCLARNTFFPSRKLLSDSNTMLSERACKCNLAHCRRETFVRRAQGLP
jgi:hypothetical protein